MMLRHIALVSLALTVSATFIPTKVNAVTLSIRTSPLSRGGELAAKPGDLITVIYRLRLDTDSKYIIPKSLATYRDGSELSLFTSLQWLVTVGRPISYEVTQGRDVDIAQLSYRVDNPVRNRTSDVWGTLIYDDYNLNIDDIIPDLPANAAGPDVVPQESVPEPLTMLGAAIALGYGAIFKRKYSKNTEF